MANKICVSKLNTDSRLVNAYASIDAKEIEVLSLDIFDTLVWRKVPEPEDLFLILGERFQKEGFLIPAVTAVGFASLRVAAERKARLEKESTQETTEVTLTEIYWHLESAFYKLSTEQMLTDKKGIYASDVSKLVQMELQLEKELLHVDENILQLIEYAKEKNIKVILVSNTYFEEEQLSFLLENFLNLKKLTALFLSCEFGCSKQNGLFECVLKKLNIPANRILHIGDHYKYDVQVAKKSGFCTLYFAKQDKKLKDLVEREWPEDLCKRKHLLDSQQGDFGLTALRAKISHHIQLNALAAEERFYWHYGATVLGPILLGFVQWIYERCEQMQVSQVFCLMREGKLYANLIERFASYFPTHRLQAKPLWVSRSFMAHAALSTANAKELLTLLATFVQHCTVENYCSYLGVDISKLTKWSKYRHMMLEDPLLRERLLRYLIKDRPLRQKIIHIASEKRQRFLDYLKTLTSLESENPLTLVDIGWNGTAQSAMQQIFKLSDISTSLHGLYLGTTEATQAALLNDIICEGYLLKGGIPDTGNAYKRGCFVLEQTATAETGVGPLIDIESTGKIINLPFLIPEKQKRQAKCVQAGIFSFFDYAGHYIKKGALKLNAHSEALQHQLRTLLLRSMINTTQAEAVKFGTWLHEHGPTAHSTQMIGKNPYYERFIKDMLPIAAFKEGSLNWPAAYTAKYSKYLTLTTEALWMNTLPPRCFLSEDNFLLKIFLDTGKNFSKKAHQSIILRSNPNRHFYTLVRVFSSKKALKRVLLMLTFPEALVRIKSLRFIAFGKKTPLPYELTFFESENSSAQIECLSGKQLDFNTFYCDDKLQLLHAFKNSDIYQIKLKLCCEMFEAPPK